MESHLLQMRGLKQKNIENLNTEKKSHLLQMRGLKLFGIYLPTGINSRIFYRCVD